VTPHGRRALVFETLCPSEPQNLTAVLVYWPVSAHPGTQDEAKRRVRGPPDSC
jgi:hypothetical protein